MSLLICIDLCVGDVFLGFFVVVQNTGFELGNIDWSSDVCSSDLTGDLENIDVQFHTSGPVFFGVAFYVPALMEYVERYDAHLNFESKLVAIDGPGKLATFEQKRGDTVTRVEEHFDMIHVVPPQVAPDFVRSSPLAAASGFIEVDEATLQHVRYANVFALGDAC